MCLPNLRTDVSMRTGGLCLSDVRSIFEYCAKGIYKMYDNVFVDVFRKVLVTQRKVIFDT